MEENKMDLKEFFDGGYMEELQELQKQYREEYPEPPTFIEWLKKKSKK